MKTEERERARDLRRRDGMPIKEIARLVGAAPSSVSLWVRDIQLTDEQRAALSERNPAMNRQRSGAATIERRARERRRQYQAEGRELARRSHLEHAAACMLFWAEGARSRTAMMFTNSDPAMVAYVLRAIHRYHGVPFDRFRVDLNLFADHVADQRRIEEHWLGALRLPRSALRGRVVNVYSRHSSRKRRNKLPYGTARLCVHSTRLVQQLYGAIQEYTGVDRPEWLD